MDGLIVFWCLCCTSFFSFALIQFKNSKRKMEHASSDFPAIGSYNGVPSGIVGVKELIKHFNGLIDDYNDTTNRDNTMAAVVNLMAFIASVISLIREVQAL